MNFKGKEKTKIAHYLLELFSGYNFKFFFVIFTITGIAIGYGFSLLSETFVSSSKGNSTILIKGEESIKKPPSNKKKLNETIGNIQLQNNINVKSDKIKKSLITPPNLQKKSIKIDMIDLFQKQKKDLRKKKNNKISESSKTIAHAQNPKKHLHKLMPKIAIVFDDLGIDMARSAKTIKLKGPLTLSFMTYAPQLKKQTKNALDAGHELWMHMPMEPRNHSIDPGPNVLLTGLPKEELQAAIRWNLKQFSNYVGINNHMGSRFTADLESIQIFMNELKKHNLMFLDSRTSSRSVAQRAAIEANVPFIVRNIFIDHINETDEIIKSLDQVERLARRSGYAVAIGHPRDKTIKYVGNWLNTFAKKGLKLVPLSKLVNSSQINTN
jgi:polysaccharide deacetylase 2 family uncharacterized protein YibQ